MGRKGGKNIERALQNGFVVVYPEKQLEGIERKIRNEQIVEAFRAVLAGILNREPTPDELYGLEDISQNVKS